MILFRLIRFLFYCGTLLMPLLAISQNFEGLYQDGLKLEKNLNEKQALIKFTDALKLDPSNASALYKCSELSCRIGARETNPGNRDLYYNNALVYAKRLYQGYPNADQSCVAMSIAMGKLALTKTGKEKISYVRHIREYAEKAIRLNAQNYKAWHVLGKWHYEVSNLNIFERAALKIIYGGLPEASMRSAIHAYEKASMINPDFGLNHLELAKAYHEEDELTKAIEQLKISIRMPNFNEDDPIVKKEAAALLKKWQK